MLTDLWSNNEVDSHGEILQERHELKSDSLIRKKSIRDLFFLAPWGK